MRRPAITVFVFGLYMCVQGLVLMLAPALLLGALRVPVPTDAWVRVVGWCLLVLGFYYVVLARANDRRFFWFSGCVRLAQFGFFAVLLAAGAIAPVLLAVSGVELASGVWTLVELRRQR